MEIGFSEEGELIHGKVTSLAKSRFWEETFSQSQKEATFPASDKRATLIGLLEYWCLSYISVTDTLTATWAERVYLGSQVTVHHSRKVKASGN